MGDSYVELLVKRTPKPFYALIKGVFLFATAALILFGLLSHFFLLLIFGILLGVVTYFVFMELDIEYEYLYVNGELSIDKIMGKQKRKNCLCVQLEKMELVAPVHSYHLADFKNQDCQEQDFSSGIGEDVYMMYYRDEKGLHRLLFEPNAKMLEGMRQMAPRKIFTD